jgi:hypothetical protein
MTTIIGNPSQQAIRAAQPRLHTVAGQQATISAAAGAATVITQVIETPCRLLVLRARTEVAGTAGTTTVVVQRNGVAVPGATVSIANTAADPSPVGSAGPTAVTDFAVGDLISLVVTAAPTAGTGLSVQAVLAEIGPAV